MDVASRLAAVKGKIAEASARAGRSPSEVTLVAVTKRQPTDHVRAAWAAGQRVFGENYPQELRARAEALQDLPGIHWHAIGTLQRNKAKLVARFADTFHALTSVEIAEALGVRREGAPLQCFLEVNVAGETTKGGVSQVDLEPLLRATANIAGIEIVGLMTMPPQERTGWVPEDNRSHFAALRALARELGLPALSMGTTEDFEVAIEEGATHVRVGRALFGERQPPGGYRPLGGDP